MLQNSLQDISRIKRRRLLAGLVAAGLSVPALAQSVPFPTCQVGPVPVP